MTAQQETLFWCDRCKDTYTVPLHNGPVATRIKPPDGWLALWLDEPTRPAVHLCPPCAFGFNAYLQDRTLTLAGVAEVGRIYRKVPP
jgi:hypothetical protein